MLFKDQHIEKAKPSDIADILNIFKDVTQLMLAQGIKQWDYSYPNEAIMAEDIKKGNCYVIRTNNELGGTITLDNDQDQQYVNVSWQKDTEEVMVIHRLAVNPAHQRKGFGTLLCKFAEHKATEALKDVIRLDAYSENPYSNKIYINLGYIRMKEYVYFHGNKVPFYCYEKCL